MEEHAVAARLGATRARLRDMLIPDPVSGRIESDSFPRSAVMRLAFDSRARRVAVTGLSLLMMFAGGRRRRAVAKPARTSLLPQLLRSAALAGISRLVRR